jgi:hypothetical protein
MTLTEFLTAQRQKLDAMEAAWIAGMRDQSENFPAEMSEGDWQEQLAAIDWRAW